MTPLAVGVDVGGTKMLALALAPDGSVIDEVRTETPHVVERPAGRTLAAAVLGAIDDLARRHGWGHRDIVVGVGLPGMMSRGGVLAFAPNLPSASGVDLAALLVERAPDLRVLCENDADCAAVAEHRLGAARSVDDVVMITLGTGIGGGIISGGELLRGRSGFAGEIGHMVVDAHGPRCPCGGRGCWERYASGAGVARLAREAAAAGRLPTIVEQRGGDLDAVRGEDVTRAAAEGLDEALAVMDEVGWWLALGVANLAAILDCGFFVVGGGLSLASELLLPAARDHLVGLLEAGDRRPAVSLLASSLKERSGAVGAALLARERLG